MRGVRFWIAAVFPLLLFASACSRTEEHRIVAPTPPAREPTNIVEARWVWEKEPLAAAVRYAGGMPAVQRALQDVPLSGVAPSFENAVRAVGTTGEGTFASLTILPYAVAGDPTHALFVSVAQVPGREAAELAEMIVGRAPRADETGFTAALWGDRPVWIKIGDPVPLESGVHQAPLRRVFTKLFQCLADRMPTGCAAGAALANDFAPGNPRATAIGCGVGAASAGVACAVDWLSGR